MRNIAGSILLLLAGCAVDAPAPDPVVDYKVKVVDTACNWTKIITVTDQRKFTDAAAKVILDQVDADVTANILTPKQVLIRAILSSNQDWLTPVTARQILAHDNARAATCK